MSPLRFLDLDPVTQGFLEYSLEVRRLSPRTIIDMRCTYRQTLAVMVTVRPGVELWRLSFDDYLAWIDLSRRKGRTLPCIAKDISHLKTLIDYAWRSGRVERNALDGFKLKDLGPIVAIPPRVLTIEEARALIFACPRKSVQQKQERMMILLLYGCGLRTGELCHLNAKDIDLERQELFIQGAKGDIQRRVPVPDSVWTELLAFLAEREGGTRRGPLFKTAAKKTRVRQTDVLTAVHAARARAGLSDDIMPKTLRHSYATHLMDAGVDLALISSLLGHKSPSESGVYLHALPGRKEAAVARLSRDPTSSEKEQHQNDREPNDNEEEV